ncbi:MAG: hypothetical protein IH964_11070, partial [Candidatus Dadabacteria bacterium]|nr:hypothetical protein [Candidatus Dadabacteria bacterium]
ALIFFNIVWAKEGQQCINNPIVYGAQKIYDDNDKLEIKGTIVLLDPRYNTIYFNKEKVWQEETYSQTNFSEVFILDNQKEVE